MERKENVYYLPIVTHMPDTGRTRRSRRMRLLFLVAVAIPLAVMSLVWWLVWFRA